MQIMTKRILSMISAALVCGGVQAGEVLVTDFDSIQLYTLRNAAGTEVKITNFGAAVTAIRVADRDGDLADIALGYADVEGYINAVDRPYFGSIVGRYGNRIAKGRFTLDGRTYELATNNGENHLHGGLKGFDKVVWAAEPVRDPDAVGVKFSYLSPDGEEGYPGNLRVTVIYTLTIANELKIAYEAETGQGDAGERHEPHLLQPGRRGQWDHPRVTT
jgi:aldose 1-epimerase